jgi:chemotaxis protein histidine kinase CheA
VKIDPLTFLSEFRTEASEHTATLDEQLLRLERDATDARPVRAMFLAAHSIKGGAAMLGLTELLELSHALENVLGALRDDGRVLSPVMAQVMFQAVDQLKALVAVEDGAPHASTPATLAIVAALTACTSTTSITPAEPGGAQQRVLLVEDSPSVRQVETFLLQDAGFIVDTVEAGNQALERANSVTYALVIAGVETRDVRGPELARALRAGAAGRQLPVLLTTTDDLPEATSSNVDLVFALKGRLDDDEFLRTVRELTAMQAA